MHQGVDNAAARALLQEARRAGALMHGGLNLAQVQWLTTLLNQGKLDELTLQSESYIAGNPRAGFAWMMRGIAQASLGKDAVSALETATHLMPADADAHYNLAKALHDAGRHIEAIVAGKTATTLSPRSAQAHHNLANSLHKLQRVGEAVAEYTAAVQIDPNLAETHLQLGICLRELGRNEDAITRLTQATELKPAYDQAHFQLATALYNSGQLDAAIAAYTRTLELAPECAYAHAGLGVALQASGRLDESLVQFKLAVRLDPSLVAAHGNLANAHLRLGQIAEAIDCYWRVLELDPTSASTNSSLLFAMTHHGGLSAKDLFAHHCRFGDRFEAPLRAKWPTHTNVPDPERRLRIGFVSGDLHAHTIAYFLAPLLKKLHARADLSLHAYYNDRLEDETSAQLRSYFDGWQGVADLDDAALADLIIGDRIDVLVDLSGHTSKNRLPVFARRPAPLQLSWMGYPGTTGLTAMDYYIADPFLMPPGELDWQYVERIVHLPATACYTPVADAPEINELPALATGYVTFGSFNRLSKITRGNIAVWSQLLRALPNSCLVIGNVGSKDAATALEEWFAQEHIARGRLNMLPKCSVHNYLKLHQGIDICLDTFPYNGGTTTMHALWMGIPTLTMVGGAEDAKSSRIGYMWLSHLGISGFDAHDAAGFVTQGVHWANNLTDLAELRAGMRNRFAQSTSCRPDIVTDAFATALRMMWRRWCRGDRPESFSIGAP